MRQEVRRKSSRAASELEDRPGLFKICMRYKIARRYIFIERLPVLQRTEPIVEGSNLFSRQHPSILEAIASDPLIRSRISVVTESWRSRCISFVSSPDLFWMF